MSRYIDAEVALQSFCAECNHTLKCEDCDIKYHLEEFVPTADVEEARHGRWLKGDEMADYPRIPYKPWETYCSCCGEIKEQSNDGFCGNCGAKMDEDGKHGGTGGHGGEIKTIYKFDENYCTEENCETFQMDLSCERCTK